MALLRTILRLFLRPLDWDFLLRPKFWNWDCQNKRKTLDTEKSRDVMSHSGFATTRSMSKGLGDIVHSWKRCCCVFHIFGKLSLSEAFYWRLMFHHPRNWKISPRWNLHEKMLGRSFLLTEDYIGKMHSNLKSDRKQTFQRIVCQTFIRRNCLMSELNW